MWLFLAQECVFFGGLFLTWIYARYWNMAGFDAGSNHTQLWIGSINAGVLVTSSFVTRLLSPSSRPGARGR